MKAADFNALEVGTVIALLDAAHALLDIDAMHDPIKFTLTLHAQAIPAAEYAMRLWAGARQCSITEWHNDHDRTRTLHMFDRRNRMLVSLHGAPQIVRAPLTIVDYTADDDLAHDDERGTVPA